MGLAEAAPPPTPRGASWPCVSPSAQGGCSPTRSPSAPRTAGTPSSTPWCGFGGYGTSPDPSGLWCMLLPGGPTEEGEGLKVSGVVARRIGQCGIVTAGTGR